MGTLFALTVLMLCQTVPDRGLHWGATNLGESWFGGGSW